MVDISWLEWEGISSSNIRAVAWDDHRLYIHFHSGGIYEYLDVPRHVFDGILSADSAGSYVHQYVLPVYGYNKIA